MVVTDFRGASRTFSGGVQVAARPAGGAASDRLLRSTGGESDNIVGAFGEGITLY